MFTGIVELMGEVKSVKTDKTNVVFEIQANFPEKIKIDQSIAHNGVCLTVTDIFDSEAEKTHYSVTAVKETLEKTNLGDWKAGKKVNIETCLRFGDRIDGHFVQGHVDTRGKCVRIDNLEGSWMYYIEFPTEFASLLVDKGSICINGVSLTVVKAEKDSFCVTIIPFTYTHTTFQDLRVGEWVNLEFDILGKYILRKESLK